MASRAKFSVVVMSWSFHCQACTARLLKNETALQVEKRGGGWYLLCRDCGRKRFGAEAIAKAPRTEL